MEIYKHKWSYNTCLNCGCMKENTKQGNYFVTLYYDSCGRPLGQNRPQCSGKIKSKAIL